MLHSVDMSCSNACMQRHKYATHVFADVVLAVGVAVQVSLLLSSQPVRLCQTVLKLLQLVIQTQYLRLLLTTFSLDAVTLHCQSVTSSTSALSLSLLLQ